MRKSRFLLAIISMFFLWLPVSQAQMKTVSGTIIAEDNQSPLSGATVKIRGTRRITQTVADGRFSIRASEGEILPISYLGYTTKDCKVGSVPSISVQEGFSK